MATSFPEAVAVVEAHAAELHVADPDAYLARFRNALEVSREDGRAAVGIAVDASKSLISIAIAFFAALGAFVLTYRSTHQTAFWSWSIVLLTLSGLLIITSMIAGFGAMGLAYRRAQRPADAAGLPWATKPISGFLGTQSLTGLGALAMFALAVGVWDAGQAPAADPKTDEFHRQVVDLLATMARPSPAQSVADPAVARMDAIAAALDRLALALQTSRADPAPGLPRPQPSGAGSTPGETPAAQPH